MKQQSRVDDSVILGDTPEERIPAASMNAAAGSVIAGGVVFGQRE